MTTLTRIGYWSAAADDGLPDVARFVDPGWDRAERDRMVDHLTGGAVARAYLGVSECRICGRRNGSLELTDGRHLWPEGLAHYLRDHGVRLPDEVVARLEARRVELEEAAVDESFWRAVALPLAPA